MRTRPAFDEAIPPLLLRLAIGMLFLVAGLNKFLGPGPAGFMRMIANQFKATALPKALLEPYGYCLPFLEVALGLFLIAGLYRRAALLATALLLLSLAFGQMLLSEFTVVAQIFLYLFFVAWTIRNSERDLYCLDRFFYH